MQTVVITDAKTGTVTERPMTVEEIAAATPTPEALAIKSRTKRDNLLSQSDWTQVADAPVDQTAWATYRQALRDITDQVGFPEVIDWPAKPN